MAAPGTYRLPGLVFDFTRIDEPVPTLRYTSLRGHTTELQWVPHAKPYTNQSKIDGRSVDHRS
jgi:hypothetical protein